MDARSTNPEVSVPSNHWHSNLLDINNTQGKQRYAYINNSISNGSAFFAETITGALVRKLPKGCYGFKISAALPNDTTAVILQYPNLNYLRVILKSSVNGVVPKVIHDLSAAGSANAIQSYSWVTQLSPFSISESEANLYDSVIVAMIGSGTTRWNHALVDEITINSKMEVGLNLPDVVRICLGNELVLTPSITYNNHTSTTLSPDWTKQNHPRNHITASEPFLAPYTLRDYPLHNDFYTFTATDNGCSASKTVQVIVEDLEEANFIGSFTECDLRGMQRYSLNNNLEGVEVSWTVSGGSLHLPPLVNPTFVDVSWNGGNQYLVVTQTGWACSRSDTLFIKDCCQGNFPSEPDPKDPEKVVIRAVNAKHSDFFSGTFVTSADVANIEINGTYTIDVMASYNGINFIMGPGAIITEQNGQLMEFVNCTFSACGEEMWQGIVVPMGQLEMEDCELKQAIRGIYMRDNALVRVRRTNFKQNYVSIYGKDVAPLGNPTNPASLLVLENDTFVGNIGGSLLKPFNQMIGSGLNSTPKNSHAAIELHNAVGIKIGDIQDPNNVNAFMGLNNGILGRFAQIDVFYAFFDTIKTNELHPQALYPLLNGTAIKYNNLNTPYVARNEKSKVLYCTIKNSQFGVDGIFTDTIWIEHSNFNKVKQGIKIVNPLGRTSISYNIIENEGVGSGIIAHSTFGSPQWILANNFTAIGNNIITTRTLGIDVIGLKTFIGNNHISLDYHTPGATFTGIRVRNLDPAIGDPTNQHESSIEMNHIKVINGVPADNDVASNATLRRWNRGIAVENCGYLSIAGNLIEKTVSAMVLEGEMRSNVQIRCNTMQDNHFGWYRLNHQISAQGTNEVPADNRWIRIKVQNARVWDPNPSNSTNNQLRYYHRGVTQPTQQQGLNVYSPAPFTGAVLAIPNIDEENRYTCNYLNFLSPDEEQGEQNYLVLEDLEEIAEGNVNYTGMAVANQEYHIYHSEADVIKAIQADSNLLSSSILSDFYGQQQDELRAKLTGAHAALLMGDLNAYAQAIGTANSSSLLFDSLQLVVGGIYARSWALPSQEPLAFDSADYRALYQIAHMDVLYGGRAVYTARVMLGIDPQPQMQLRQQAETEIRFVTEELLRIYPNPAQNDVRLALEGLNEAQATYSIIDINGRKVAHGSVEVYDGFGYISLNSLPNGVFVLQVQAQDTLHQTKLVIVKP